MSWLEVTGKGSSRRVRWGMDQDSEKNGQDEGATPECKRGSRSRETVSGHGC